LVDTVISGASALMGVPLPCSVVNVNPFFVGSIVTLQD
jgi:hypothetical protein